MNNEWKMVPAEPTDAMKKAIYGLLSAYDDGSDITPSFFMKMLINAAPVPPAGDVEVLAVVALGGYFSSEELGDIDIQPRMAALEQIQQDVVRTDADEHIELVDRAHVTRLQAVNAALQARLTVADQRVDDLQSDLNKARELLENLCDTAYIQSSEGADAYDEARGYLARQSAPAAKGESDE